MEFQGVVLNWKMEIKGGEANRSSSFCSKLRSIKLKTKSKTKLINQSIASNQQLKFQLPYIPIENVESLLTHFPHSINYTSTTTTTNQFPIPNFIPIKKLPSNSSCNSKWFTNPITIAGYLIEKELKNNQQQYILTIEDGIGTELKINLYVKGILVDELGLKCGSFVIIRDIKFYKVRIGIFISFWS